ncbi:MAG: ATP-binding cassette domain-containing protein [Pirellulales bacterium]
MTAAMHEIAAPAARLQVRQLTKRLSAAFCLRVAQLDLAVGETLALVGPTGSGKSTLIRLLAGLEPIDEGSLVLDGQPLAPGAVPQAVQRRIAWVPQTPLLLRGSVRYNAAYGRRIRGLADDDVVTRLLEQLELRSLAEQSAQTLSGGQTQLTALARALACEPDILLVDEPTASLDPARVALVEQVLQRYARERRPTVVWATHNLFQARRTADRVCLLLDGAIVETSPTEDFFTRPQDPRSADFVAGRMIY